MPTISAADLAILRSQKPTQAKLRWYMAIAPWGDPVFEAQVNGSVSDPNMDIPYDNGTGSVEAGMTLWVGDYDPPPHEPTAKERRNKGVVRVRSDASGVSGTLDVAENYDIEWADDLYICAPGQAGFRQIWSRYQFIDADGNIFKDYDITYADADDPGSDIPPKANAGPPVCVWLDEETGEVEVDFIGEDSYVVGIESGETLDTYTWDFDLQAGEGVVWGDADHIGTEASPNVVTFNTAGFRYVSLTVENNEGKTNTVYVPVWIFDEGTTDPIKDFEVREQTCTVDSGWSAQVVVRATDNETVYDFPEGALVVIFTRTEYDGTAANVGGYHDRGNIRMVGWINEETLTFDYETGTCEFQIISHDQRMRNLFGLGFTFEEPEDGSSDDWHEISNLDVDRALQMHFYWHTTLCEVCHIEKAGEAGDRAFWRWICAETNLYAQTQEELCIDANYWFLSDRQGIVRITQNPQYIDTASRSAAICTLQQADWRNDIAASRRQPHAGYVKIGGFIPGGASGDYAKLSWAPGVAPKQAPDELDQEGFIVQSQTELNAWSGFKLAEENNPYPEVPVELYGYWPVFDPAFQEFVKLSADDPLDRNDWNEERFIVRGVTFRDLPEDGTTITELNLEMESSGPSGVTRDIPEPPEYDPPDPPDWHIPPPPPWPDPDWPEGVGMALAWHKNHVAWTGGLLPVGGGSWEGAGPTWTDVTGAMAGDEIRQVKYVQTSGTTVGAWAMTDNGLYWSADVLQAGLVWTQVLTLAQIAGYTGAANDPVGIHAWTQDSDFLILSIHGSSGNCPSAGGGNMAYPLYTTDGGATWNTPTTQGWAKDAAPMGVAVNESSGGIYLVGACGIFATNYYVQHSTDGGASYTKVSGLYAGGFYRWGYEAVMRVPLLNPSVLYIAINNILNLWNGTSITNITPTGMGGIDSIENYTNDPDHWWFVANDNELWITKNSFSTYRQLTGLLGDGDVFQPGGWPGDPNIIFITRDTSDANYEYNYQYTDDEGENWYSLTGDWAAKIGGWANDGAFHPRVVPLPRVGANAP